MTTINRFDHIEHMPLRVFNRAALTFNLLEDFGETAMKEYLEEFDEGEKKQIFIMVTYIQQKGLKAAQDFVTKGLDIQYNVGEEENEETN